MNAWGKVNNTKDKIIMVSDPFSNFTNFIGVTVDKTSKGLGIRSIRYSMLIENLSIIRLNEEKDTGICQLSAADNFLNLI